MHPAILLSVCGLTAVSAVGGESRKELVPTPEAPLTGVVNVDRLNVRKGPGTPYDRLGQLDKGDELVVRHAEGKWYEVDYPAGLPVWISAKYVEVEGEAEKASLEAPLVGVITRPGVRLRGRPSLARSVVLGERQKDDVVRVAGAFNGWYRIVPPADMRCYLHADYVDLVGPHEAAAEEPGVDEVLPLELGTGEAPVDEAVPGDTDTLESAMESVRLAGEMLSQTPSLEDAERALRLLERALASGEPGVREAVKEVLGGPGPGVWLSLFDKARRGREGGSADASPGDTDPGVEIEYTARGLLLAPVGGTGRYRLVHGDALLYELEPEVDGADLSPFVGRAVGVVGGLRAAERPGEAPWIVVRYIEELDELASTEELEP